MRAMIMMSVLCFAAVAAAQEIRIDGSTTVGPIVEAFAETFKKTEDGISFSVKKTGSGDGAASLIAGRCEIAAMSRFMKPEEYKKAVAAGKIPVPVTICMDGVCFIVHPSNPIRKLTRQQIADIYTGKISNWKELGGIPMPLVAISRDTSSGTYEVFHEFILGKEKMSSKTEYTNSNPQMFTRVSTTPGAIGYVGAGFLQEGVGVVQFGLDAGKYILPDKETIASGVYPLSRRLYLFTDGEPPLGSPLARFCGYFLTKEGQEIIISKGYVPLTKY